MKKLILILAISLAIAGCKSVQYVPVEKVKIEYRDREKIQKDTIIRRDSIRIHEKGDTVFVERFRDIFKYRDRFVRDSIHIHDSIPVPYPVEKIKEVHVLTRWQSWQLMTFRILMFFAIAWATWKFGIKGGLFSKLLKLVKP